MTGWSLTLVGATLSWWLTGALRRYALRKNLIDTPNARSSHEVPTPRGGGLSFVVAFVLASTVYWALGHLGTAPFAAVVGGGAAVAALGWWDDHADLSRRLRLVFQFAAAGWALAWLGGVPTIPVGPWTIDAGYVPAVVALVAIVWLINLYNFMDGIDAIAGLQAVAVASGAALILASNGAYAHATWSVILASTVAGFLVWNWPPARIFMGDAGSAFLGFVLVAMALGTAHAEAISVWSWIILLGVFLVDATVTLLTRMIRRERWFDAHREHAYQHAARAMGSHRPVSLGVAAIDLLWLLPFAWLADTYETSAWWITLAAYAPLIAASVWLRAGRPDSDSSGTSTDANRSDEICASIRSVARSAGQDSERIRKFAEPEAEPDVHRPDVVRERITDGSEAEVDEDGRRSRAHSGQGSFPPRQ